MRGGKISDGSGSARLALDGFAGSGTAAEKGEGENGKEKIENGRRQGRELAQAVRVRGPLFEFPFSDFLENVAAQVLVLHDIRQLLLHVGGVHFKGFLLHFRSFEGNFLENFFQNGVQAARADIFGVLVHLGGEARDRGDGVFA